MEDGCLQEIVIVWFCYFCSDVTIKFHKPLSLPLQVLNVDLLIPCVHFGDYILCVLLIVSDFVQLSE